MENFAHSFALIMPMVLVLALGNILKAVGFFKEHDLETLSQLLYWVLSPVMMFRNAFYIQDVDSTGSAFFGSIVAAALLVMLTAGVLEYVWQALTRQRNYGHVMLAVAASMRANTVYMGVPMITTAFGQSGLGYLSLYLALALPLYNFLSPVSIELMRAKDNAGRSKSEVMRDVAKSLVRNPMIVSALVGMAIAFAGIPLHSTVDGALTMLNNAASGLSLLLIGASIDLRRARKAFVSCWRDVFIRLFAHPALLFVCMTIFGIGGEMRAVSVLDTATPTAVTLYVIARGMGLDETHVSEETVITTLLSVITMPLWITWLTA